MSLEVVLSDPVIFTPPSACDQNQLLTVTKLSSGYHTVDAYYIIIGALLDLYEANDQLLVYEPKSLT